LFGFDGTEAYKHYAKVLSDDKKSSNYSVFKGADIWNYPQFYNYMDCSLVPLEDTKFNSMKSPLKLIEAGFFSKAVIVSPVAPYDEIITDNNCLTATNKIEWVDACRKLINDRELAKELGKNLNKSVQKFSIENVNKNRYKILTDVLENPNTNSREELSRMVTV
jgi:glycosyltransferase involved in cell wall biosynthesis